MILTLAVLAPAAGAASITAAITGLACYARAIRDDKHERQETGR